MLAAASSYAVSLIGCTRVDDPPVFSFVFNCLGLRPLDFKVIAVLIYVSVVK